jgi:hypothetical protein
MSSKAQLHQIFPVESNLSGKCNKILSEAIHTFQRNERFDGYTKILTMFDENRKKEEGSPEVVEVSTTVKDKLDYIKNSIVKYYDAFAQKEKTNQKANADVILDDGTVLLKNIPATCLLGLEKKLVNLRQVFESIPTLPPGVKWEKSEDEDNIYICPNEIITNKTEKTIQHKSIAKATDRHPEQVEKWTADVPVGKYTLTKKTGRISSGEKSKLLGRTDELIIAVKKARTIANNAEIESINIGEDIVKYILAPLED